MKVLLIEHADDMRQMVAARLRRTGLVVEAAADGESGLWAALHLDPDVIVIDSTQPGLDGSMLLRRLRADGVATPVLMFTAMNDVEDRLRAFEAGADDCMPEPVDWRELAARLRALACRAGAAPCEVLQLGELRIDLARGTVFRGELQLPMRRRERLLLEVLVSQKGQVVSRDRIEAKLYSQCIEPRSNCVEAAMSQLRRWIDVPQGPSRITTLRGEGYRLER